jgi:hypothetical protein
MRFLGLEEELHDLEEKTTAQHKGQDDCEHVSTSSSKTVHVSANDVLIQNLLMGDFWGSRFLGTTASVGLPIFFSCALAKRMFACRCWGVCAFTCALAWGMRQEYSRASRYHCEGADKVD